MFFYTPAKKEEADEIAKLVNSVYRGETGMRSWTGEAHLLGGQRVDASRIRELIDKDDSIIMVARNPEISKLIPRRKADLQATPIIGCFHLRREPYFAYLGMLTVGVDQQSSGLGTALLVEAERFAREEWSSPEMRMTVISLRTELIDWYRRRGYSPTGEKAPFPYGDERFGQPKRNDLEFLVLHKRLT